MSGVPLHPVPVDLNILKALKRFTLGLDLYLWVAYQTFSLKHPMRLSWKHLYRQFGVDPAKAGDKRPVDDFRKDCLRELKKIQAAWPDLNYAMAQGALILWPSKPAITPQAPASTRGVALPEPRNVTLTASGILRGFFLWYPRQSRFWGLLRAFSTKPL